MSDYDLNAPVYILDTRKLNEPMREGFARLHNAAHRARWTNAVTRKDGIETSYEADWIKCMTIQDGEEEYKLREKYPAVAEAYSKYRMLIALVKEEEKQ